MMKQLQQFILYLKSFYHGSPRIFIVGCSLTVINTILTGVGMLLLIPLLHYSGWLPKTFNHSDVLTNVLNSLPQTHGKISLLITLCVFVVLILNVALIDYWQSKYQANILQNHLYDLRTTLSQLVARAKWSYLLRNKMQHYEHMVGMGLQQISVLNNYFILLISDAIVSLIYLGFSFIISPQLSLISFIFLGLLTVFFLKARSALIGQETFNLGRNLQNELVNCLDGIKLAKAYNAIDSYAQRFQTLNKQLRAQMLLFFSNQRRIKLIYRVGAAIIFALVFYSAMHYLQVSLLTMVAMLVIYARLVPRILSLQQNTSRVNNLLPVFAEAEVMISDLQQHQEIDSFKSSIANIKLQNNIQFKHIRFAYESNEDVVMNFDLTMPANVTSAIIGVSGAGKSTLADLLLGLLIPQQGHILVDGVPLTTANICAWREQVAYVPQETFLFNDTIRNNLLWAYPQADEADLWQALKQAAADFVGDLPAGIDSLIGDRGIHLAGGERQRLGLARALLRRPSVLVLDEATSALDQINEKKIFNTLVNLHGQMTIIIIAHRLSTIKFADHVFVIKEGRVVEQGNIQELLNNSENIVNLYQG